MSRNFRTTGGTNPAELIFIFHDRVVLWVDCDQSKAGRRNIVKYFSIPGLHGDCQRFIYIVAIGFIDTTCFLIKLDASRWLERRKRILRTVARTSTSRASYCLSFKPPVFPFRSFSYILAFRSSAARADSRVGLLMVSSSTSRAPRNFTPGF